jgi:hypothetical protein
MQMKKSTAIEPSYVERADKDRRKEVAEGLRQIAADERVIVKSRARVELEMVAMINAMRHQGETLQLICGHEQISFQFVKQFSINGEKTRLPWGDGTNSNGNLHEVFDTAKRRVALAARLPDKIERWEDVAVDSRRAVFLQLEFLQVGERGLIDDGTAPPPNDPLAFVFRDLVRLKHGYEKCLRLKPLEQRSPAQIEDFLDQTQWIEEQRAAAKRLLRK